MGGFNQDELIHEAGWTTSFKDNPYWLRGVSGSSPVTYSFSSNTTMTVDVVNSGWCKAIFPLPQI